MKINMIKRNGVFTPAYDSDYEKAKKLKDGEYEFKISLLRNPGLHRKFFSLINLTLHNQDTFDSLEDLRAFLIMKAGYYKTVQTETGYMYIPKSISFEKMDNSEFEQLYSDVLNQVLRFLKCDEKMVNDELINYM